MSIAQAAELVRSKGRGEDTVLIHMTPGEVKGLQAIALAHGGSLTINPETGLPEAGFLNLVAPDGRQRCHSLHRSLCPRFSP